jgi:RNA polymerase sigma factor (TIGR02999 family)
VPDVCDFTLPLPTGDPSSANGLLPLIYDELQALAAAKLRREKPGQTLDPTALVHEAYLRLINANTTKHWDSRGHLFAAAAEAMRRILIEEARRKRLALRPGQASHSFLVKGTSAAEFERMDILALNEALEKFEVEHPSKARIVKLYFFSGLSQNEIAAVMRISPITVKRYWRFARIWLHREMQIAE